MAKTVTLKHIGYLVTGEVEVVFWGGDIGFVQMDQTEIPTDKFSKDMLMCSINDGRFGVERILSANLRILDLYEKDHVEFNRRIWVDGTKLRQRYFCRGI